MKKILLFLAMAGPMLAQFGNATRIQSRPVAATAPSDTNVICWDASAVTWKPCSATSGSANSHTTFSNVASVAITLTGVADKAVIACFDNSTPPQAFIPDHIQQTDANTVTVYFVPNATGYCNASTGSGATGATGATGAAGAAGPISATGGSNGTVQYRVGATTLGGITGATTDGTTLTLVAPVLGTPASVNLANATNLPAASVVAGSLGSGNYTVTGNLTATGSITSGSGSGVGGALDLTQGTLPSIVANTISHVAPTSVTGYEIVGAGAAGTGIPHWSNAANVVTESVGLIVNADITNATIAAAKLVGTDIATLGTVTAGVWNGTAVGTTYGGLGAALNAAAAHSTIISNGATPAVYSAKTIPDCTDTGGNHLNFTQSTDAFSCGTSGGSSGANTALSNLASVSINSVLGFQTGIAVGNTTNPAKNIVFNASGTYGTGSFTFAGTPTANRTLIIPDVSDTFAFLGQANAFTAAQSVTLATTNDQAALALQAISSTPATSGNQKFSPCLFTEGNGWKTDATAGSQTSDWCMQSQPLQGTANPFATLALMTRTNGGAYVDALSVARNLVTAVNNNLTTIHVPNALPTTTNYAIALDDIGELYLNGQSGFGVYTMVGGTIVQRVEGSLITLVQPVKFTNKATTYNNIATVSNGIPAEYAAVDLTGQSAAKGSTALYTPAATGFYRISYYAKVTTAASVSSILGGTAGFGITYTDGTDSVAQTAFILPEDDQNGSALAVGTGNTTNTTQAVVHGSVVIYALTGVAINYTFGYSSTGGTAMQYELHAKLEAL